MKCGGGSFWGGEMKEFWRGEWPYLRLLSWSLSYQSKEKEMAIGSLPCRDSSWVPHACKLRVLWEGRLVPRSTAFPPSSFHKQLFWSCFHSLPRHLDYHLFPYSLTPLQFSTALLLWFSKYSPLEQQHQHQQEMCSQWKSSGLIADPQNQTIWWQVVREENWAAVCVVTSPPGGSHAYCRKSHCPLGNHIRQVQ